MQVLRKNLLDIEEGEGGWGGGFSEKTDIHPTLVIFTTITVSL
jgi:hypothetical protein